MYRVYTRDPKARLNLGIRRRLAPLLHNDRRRIELLNALLFSLPGTPVLYYGDEIGMGDNVRLGDRGGVRTPMQWSAGRNGGFSTAPARRLYLPAITEPPYGHPIVNVEAQRTDPHSLLSWVKRLIAVRKRHSAFGRGTFELLHPENPSVLAYLRRHEGETILVVANLSRFAQPCVLDLGQESGSVPTELFGGTELARIGTSPYTFALSPHAFHWLALEEPRRRPAERREREPAAPDVALSEAERLFKPASQAALSTALPAYLAQRRWFGRAKVGGSPRA